MMNLGLLLAIDPGEFCAGTANIWQIVGWVLTVLKIAIPLLIIILGMIDLGKAVISSDDDAIKKSAMSLMKRAIAGVIIFFIPTLVTLVIGLVNRGSNDADVCLTCLGSPSGADCSAEAEAAWSNSKVVK